jgi:rubredoxin
MERVDPAWKCPRCAVSPHPFIGDDDEGATSRASMSELPTIAVCTDCREREAFTASAGLEPIPPERWPVPLDYLLAEDRERYAYKRAERVPGGGVWVNPRDHVS